MPHHVLIVDDQRTFSRLLRSALEMIEQGLIVSEAQSGEEGILEASRTRVDLLVADFRLPGINGLELMKKFRVINPNGKVIIVSGVSEPWLLKQINDASADAFFPKPISTGDFLEAVEDCLGLVRTIVHPEEKKEKSSPAKVEPTGLAALLVNLRQDLGAQAVLLLNDMGHVEAEAGQMPGLHNEALASALIGLSNAAQKAASLIDHAESHLHLFSGKEFDGIFLPVGSNHALMSVGKGLAEARFLATRLDLLFTARVNMLEAISRVLAPQASPIGVNVDLEAAARSSGQVSAIDEPYTHAEDLPRDFLNIFAQIGDKVDDANTFWDTAVEKGTTFQEPDKLTYEQASRLGLTPDSAQE